jgi:uncharacterized membrane protein
MTKEKIVWFVVGLLALLVVTGAVAYVMTRGHHVSPSPISITFG